MGNIHADARLAVEPGHVDEDREQLTRIIRGRGEQRLRWRFAKREHLRFTAIGDSDGGRELAWCLKRSADLNADFMLHLGNFYYQKGDLERAAGNLASAPLPCYSAIGNHDFHADGSSVHREFTQLIGTRNSMFGLGKVLFVNLYTAADSVPSEGAASCSRPCRSWRAIRKPMIVWYTPTAH